MLMSSSDSSLVSFVQGDLLASRAQTLVNTVNCVGIMGKGIALSFKKRYPDMFLDYVRRCEARVVKLGEPYPYQTPSRLIVNFPTKDHWRSVSRLEDIEDGLRYLRVHLQEWGVTSIAVPPLGCGNGQLDWSVVGPTLDKHLRTFGIPVELYVPHGVEPDNFQPALIESPTGTRALSDAPRVPLGALALVDILARLEEDPYHWPAGRVMFQKIAYFATVAGIPTTLVYEANDYGPFAPTLTRLTAQLQNNGLVSEERRGNMIETRVGQTFADARRSYSDQLQDLDAVIERVVDLAARFDSRRAEVAGSVHYVAAGLARRRGRRPSASAVLQQVETWKSRRKPPITSDDIARSIVELAALGWIDIEADESLDGVIQQSQLDVPQLTQ
jgi:O-acetyl-ADP-ribose deacetylase (regulator of RNase III)